MALTKRTRFEVLRRDGHRCRYCGDTAEAGATLTVDHVVPVALGGTDEPRLMHWWQMSRATLCGGAGPWS